MDLNRLERDLRNALEYEAERFKPVQVLNEDGEVFDIVRIEYDPEAEVTYLKCELAD